MKENSEKENRKHNSSVKEDTEWKHLRKQRTHLRKQSQINLSNVLSEKVILGNRVAEVAREHGWHPPKSLDSDENFKPEHTLFCRELRFVAIYTLFGDLWAKKYLFG